MEDAASKPSSNLKRDTKYNQEADPKTRVKPIPKTPLSDQSEASFSNVAARSSRASADRSPTTSARTPTRVRKKKSKTNVSRIPESDSAKKSEHRNKTPIISTGLSPKLREESPVVTSKRSKHHEKESERGTENPPKKNIKKYKSRERAKSAEIESSMKESSLKTSENTNGTRRRSSMKDLTKLNSEDDENHRFRGSMVRIIEENDSEEEHKKIIPLEHANFSESELAMKTSGQAGTSDDFKDLGQVAAGGDKDDDLYVQSEMDLRNLDLEFNKAAMQRLSTVHGRRRSLERSSPPAPYALQRAMKYRRTSNPPSRTDSKVSVVRTQVPVASLVLDWEPDEQRLLYWTTPARERDVAAAKRRLARKEAQSHKEYEPYSHRPDTQFTCAAELAQGLLAMTPTCGSRIAYVQLHNEYAICRLVKEPWLGLPRTVEYACRHGPTFCRFSAPFFKYFICILMASDGISIATTYYYMMSQFMVDFCDEETCSFVDLRLFILALLPVLLVCTWFHNAKSLFVFSITANLLTATAAVLIIVTVYKIDPGGNVSMDIASADERTFPVFLRASLFSLNHVPVVMFVERNMRNPQELLGFKGVLTRAVVLAAFILLLVAICCYTHMGNEVKHFIQQLFTGNKMSDASRAIVGLSWVMSYPINIYAVYDLIWQMCVKNAVHEYPQNRQEWIGFALKTGIILVTATIAVTVPNFLTYGSMVHAITVPSLVMVFPALVEMLLCWEMRNFGRCYYVLFKDLLMLILAIYCGTYAFV